MDGQTTGPGSLRFGVLGPLEVTRDQSPVPLGPPQQRAVLSVLVCDAGRLVTRARLVDALWGEHPQPGAVASLQTHVSRLRTTLEPGRADGAPPQVLVTEGQGYRLTVRPEAVDAQRFETMLGQARQGVDGEDPNAALAAYDRALALWRGDVLADVSSYPFVGPIATRLTELRLAAEEGRIAAHLDLGRDAIAVAEAERLLGGNPLRERVHAQLMLGLYRSGRQADALAAYRRLRTVLHDELGIEPGPDVQRLHRRILDQDPVLTVDTMRGHVVAVAAATSAADDVGAATALVSDIGAAAVPAPQGRRHRRRRVAVGVSAVVAAALVAGVVAVSSRGEEGVALGGNSLGVLDTKGRIVAAVPVGINPTALAYGGGSVWVANQSDDTVMRVDPQDQRVSQTFLVGHTPGALVATADDVWVANFADGTVTRISISANRVVQAKVQVGARPAALAAGPGGVWVANSGDNTVQRIDSSSGKPDVPVNVGDGPDGLMVDGGSVWVANGRDGTVSRLVAASGVEAASPIPVGAGPRGMARVGQELWVANQLSQSLTRMAVSTGLTQTVQVGDGPTSVASFGGSVWVAEQYAGRLSRVDPATGARTVSALGASPRSLLVVGDRMWVAVGAGSTTAHHGGTLTVAAPVIPGELEGIDPATVYEVITSPALRLVYDGLVAIRYSQADSQTLVPDLATRLPIPSDGGRTYTFELRSGIRYSTGEQVRASDFVRGVQRTTSQGFNYDAIVGARTCRVHPSACDLTRGVVVDDLAGRVTFHLTTPDPDFVYKLSELVYPIPPGQWGAGPTTRLPGTGPYRITAYVQGERFELGRSPQFRQWSVAAAPPGYPDVITWLRVKDLKAAAAAVTAGRADLVDLAPIGDNSQSGPLVDDLRIRRPAQIHSDPSSATTFWALDSSRPPFDDVRVRQALNYAVDRRAFIDRVDGASVFQPSCQLLPPGFPGYRQSCQYTTGPRDGSYHGPDLATARRLIAQSGTAGMTVRMVDVADRLSTSGDTFIATVLKRLGYRVAFRLLPNTTANVEYVYGYPPPYQVIIGGWIPDYPRPSAWYDPLVRCGASAYYTRHCDRALDARATAATALATTNPGQSLRDWMAIDRAVADDAPLVFGVSKTVWWYTGTRVGNYQSAQSYGPLLSQLWVR